jgi:hypothetical protein
MIALFTVALTSCSPEDGKDGVDGIDGEQGIPGQDGNANVTSYLFEDLTFAVGDNGPYNVPAITEDILSNGVVLGYISVVNPTWFPLPYINDINQLSINYVEIGSVVINSNFNSTIVDLRIVVIEGNPGNGGKGNEGKISQQAIYDELKTAGVDINNYDAVVNYYNTKTAN